MGSAQLPDGNVQPGYHVLVHVAVVCGCGWVLVFLGFCLLLTLLWVLPCRSHVRVVLGTEGASSVSSVFTLCNSAIGAGVLSLPYAFQCAGECRAAAVQLCAQTFTSGEAEQTVSGLVVMTSAVVRVTLTLCQRLSCTFSTADFQQALPHTGGVCSHCVVCLSGARSAHHAVSMPLCQPCRPRGLPHPECCRGSYGGVHHVCAGQVCRAL